MEESPERGGEKRERENSVKDHRMTHAKRRDKNLHAFSFSNLLLDEIKKNLEGNGRIMLN